ncbi:transposase [Microcoleus sp. N3A4]|uniref:transposase n=1 Tax=Microcoleus sp. N3A4 TaxID=3055379 RepID=UPI002FCEAA38
MHKYFSKNQQRPIVNHFEGICNYFLDRTISGVMEGINHRIKLIMRQGYGFSNARQFSRSCISLLF